LTSFFFLLKTRYLVQGPTNPRDQFHHPLARAKLKPEQNLYGLAQLKNC